MNVLLRLGPECNQRCIFCNVPTCERMSTRQALDWLKSQSGRIDRLSITGGEPTLRKDIFLVIKEASRTGTFDKICLQTNATLASYEQYASKLKETGLDMALVAFHSHIEGISNKLTCSRLWGKTVSGIKNFLKEGISVTLNPVINSLSYKLLPRYVRFVKEKLGPVDAISFSFVQPAGRAWANKWVVPRYFEVFPYLKEALQYCDENNMNYSNPYCGFPMCFFPGPKERCNEFTDKRVNHKLEREAVGRVRSKKTKSPACDKCAYNDKCNGVWINYARIYGLSELNPIKTKK